MFERVPEAIRARLILSSEPHAALGTHCWLCCAGRFTPNGYARLYLYRNHEVVLHRFLYKLLIDAELPKSLLLNHLCRIRNCVNPFHLEPVTNRENTLRGNAVLFAPALYIRTDLIKGNDYVQHIRRCWAKH